MNQEETKRQIRDDFVEQLQDLARADPDIQALIISATPETTHYPMARDAMSAGKHVFGVDQRDYAGDVHVLPAEGGASPQQETEVYAHLVRDFRLPRQEAVQWKGDDGADRVTVFHYRF